MMVPSVSVFVMNNGMDHSTYIIADTQEKNSIIFTLIDAHLEQDYFNQV